MTYKYRIYTFHNGLGETVFRAKRVRRLPAWATAWVSVGVYDTEYGEKFSYSEWLHSKWVSRGAVLAAIQEDARKQNQDRRWKMGETLKLIIVEDESVEVK